MSDAQTPERADTAPLHTGQWADAPIGAAKEPTGVRWLTILLAFMRIAACFWLLKGILQWAAIIGLSDIDFPELRLSRQGIIIAFAVMDLVAAVGLWLTSSWGAAVWLVLLFAQGAAPFLMPDLTPSVVDALVSAGFGGTYLLLVWKALQEERAQ
ncbi:MAG TPA: hypothetical protein PK812_08610 [Beijerinckiaceae bacterium]|nr:hypothetical protein [Beijerinckiaceae bacterium]